MRGRLTGEVCFLPSDDRRAVRKKAHAGGVRPARAGDLPAVRRRQNGHQNRAVSLKRTLAGSPMKPRNTVAPVVVLLRPSAPASVCGKYSVK